VSKQYDNTNTGALFLNERKTDEKHPDRTGSINVEGIEYFLDGWIRKTKDGKQFLSVRVKRKDGQQAKPQQPQEEDAF
jgi:uncharacterized protein (DUF736 family)